MEDRGGKRVHLTAEELAEISRAALRGIGYSESEAEVINDHVVDAALCGYEYLALPKVLRLHSHFVEERREPRVVELNDWAVSIDAGHNTGMLVMVQAAREVIDRASTHGFSIVAVRNAWMSGRSAYYCEMVARAGLICFHSASGTPLVAPPGGLKPVLGTNPIAFGFPSTGDPLVIDLGSSAIAATDLDMRARTGARLPDGAAIDAAGRPTTDPLAASQGSLLHFGAHKGFALALAMHALGVLCGDEGDEGFVTGHVIAAFSPSRFLPEGKYERLLAEQLAYIKSMPTQEGYGEIRLPGERAYSARDRARREGVHVDEAILAQVRALARDVP